MPSDKDMILNPDKWPDVVLHVKGRGENTGVFGYINEGDTRTVQIKSMGRMESGEEMERRYGSVDELLTEWVVD